MVIHSVTTHDQSDIENIYSTDASEGKLTDGDHGFTLYDLTERVRLREWQIASYPLPLNRQDTIVQLIPDTSWGQP